MNEMIQEAVLNGIDVIDEAQLFAEYDVLIAMADVYAKSALIQEENVGLIFDGEQLVQEQEAGKSDDKASESGYDQGELKEGSGGPTVPSFMKLSKVTDKKWYQKIWEWIKNACRFIKKHLLKLGRRLKKAWINVKTLTDAEANAYRKIGCKIVPNDQGGYTVAYPFEINLEEISTQLDKLIEQIFKPLGSFYDQASGDNNKLDDRAKRLLSNAKPRIDGITAAVKKATNGKWYVTPTNFFEVQEELVGRLDEMEKGVDTIKKVYVEDANRTEYVQLAAKAAGVFNIINKAVQDSFEKAADLIGSYDVSAKTVLDKKGLKKDAKNLKKEQKAIQERNAAGELNDADDEL